MDGDVRNTAALTRRGALTLAGGVLATAGVGGSITSPALTNARATAASEPENGIYLDFMDMVCERLNGQWSTVRGVYWPTVGGYSTLVNARMLQVHANAAVIGHTGPSRNDARVLSLVAVLLASPAPWRTEGNSVTRKDKMFHIPGWTESLKEPNAAMDKAVDPQVAEALAAAWRAAEILGMDPDTRQQIIEHVSGCARGPFFRYPSIRLNQLNWNSALYALDAELTGSPDLLSNDYREQMLRFATYATRPEVAGDTPNLGSGWHFCYLPNWPPTASFNLDAAEYANETLDAVRHYSQALAAGMAPLPSWALGVLRSWAWRVLYGYWTHAGYLNWDTGLGERRRYIGKVFALAQQGLLAIAVSPTFHLDAAMAGHARWLFDRCLALYGRWASEDPSGLAPAVQFGDREHPQSEESTILFAARTASNAAQAVHLGVGYISPVRPPSMYSFDPDSQRLAVSTPHYSTAIVVHNRGAVRYGGIDLCRLFDSVGRPVGCTAGFGIANFLARVLDDRGGVLVDTQMGTRASMSVAAVDERGNLRRAGPGSAPYPSLPYAGPMRFVAVSGRVDDGGVGIETEHELLVDGIHLRWRMSLADGGGWEVALPSYGSSAKVVAERRSGHTQLLSSRPAIALEDIAKVLISAAAGSYTVEVLGQSPPATLRLVAVPPGLEAANPGPSLLIAGRGQGDERRVELALRLRVL